MISDPLGSIVDPAVRNREYVDRLHSHFRAEIVDQYPDRVARTWQWDHTDEQSFVTSVVDQREAWRQVINPPTYAPVVGPVATESAVPGGFWIDVAVAPELSASGLLVVPPGATRLMVFQHGLGSWPEKVFGHPDADNPYHGIGRDLADRGYAVLAPMNATGVELRNRVQDLARLTGTTMEGVELARCRVLLDAVATLQPELDAEAIAMTGISWGGMAAQFWTPLEDRFCAAASIGFFNDRTRKMALLDERYSSFAETGGHHAFLRDHLGVFSDAELASLICPRPFLVQHGVNDGIGWPPMLEQEFDRARHHWEQLGIGDRAEIQVFDGGHEVECAGLFTWLDRVFPAGGPG